MSDVERHRTIRWFVSQILQRVPVRILTCDVLYLQRPLGRGEVFIRGPTVKRCGARLSSMWSNTNILQLATYIEPRNNTKRLSDCDNQCLGRFTSPSAPISRLPNISLFTPLCIVLELCGRGSWKEGFADPSPLGGFNLWF